MVVVVVVSSTAISGGMALWSSAMAELERKRIDRESHRGTGVGLWSLWLETTTAAATVA